jgi:rubrerythrin
MPRIRGEPRKWTEEDGEEMLWVCVSCGAELHADCVGQTCPCCGVDTAPDEDRNTTGLIGGE